MLLHSDREELGDTTQNHEDTGCQVDDAAAKGDGSVCDRNGQRMLLSQEVAKRAWY